VEIPLVLSSPRPDRLVYALPIWFRVLMGGILALVATALLMGEDRPGALAWTVLVILLLSFLYDDRWVFDASKNHAVHRAGLLVGSKSTVIAFSAMERFCIVPLVKGTIPGSDDERAENAAALKGQRTDDGQLRRFRHRKPFLSLEIEGTDGTRYLVDHVPARCAEKLRGAASRMAELCGKPLSEA